MDLRRTFFCILGFVLTLAPVRTLGQTQIRDDAILGRVGQTDITFAEFRQRSGSLHGLTLLNRDSVAMFKRSKIYSLVAEKVLSTVARQQAIDRVPSVHASLEKVRRSIAREGWFEINVRQKVSVSRTEISEAVKQARRQRTILLLSGDDPVGLERAAAGAHATTDLIRIAELHGSGLRLDSLTVRWTDGGSGFGAAAYATGVGKVSPVIRTGVGWSVVGVVSESTDSVWIALDARTARSQAEAILRIRKETHFVERLLGAAERSSVDRAFDPSFRMFAEALRAVWTTFGCKADCSLTTEQEQVVLGLLKEHADDTLAVTSGRTMTIRQGLLTLGSIKYSVSSMQWPFLEQELFDLVGVWSFHEQIEATAVSSGTETHPEMARMVNMWHDYELAAEMVRRVETSTRFDELDVYLHIHRQSPWIPMPVLDVRIASGPGLAEIAAFLDEAQGLPLPAQVPAVRGVNVRELRKVPVTQLGIVAPIAWKLHTGEWSRPSVVDTQVISVQLLEFEEPDPRPADWDSLSSYVRVQKLQRATTELIARLAQRLPIEVNWKLLDLVDVASMPKSFERGLEPRDLPVGVPGTPLPSDWVNLIQKSTKTPP